MGSGYIYFVLFIYLTYSPIFGLKCLSTYCIESDINKNRCEVCHSNNNEINIRWKQLLQKFYPHSKLNNPDPLCCNSNEDGYCLSHIYGVNGKQGVTLECSQENETLPLLQKSICNLTSKSYLQCCTSDFCNIFGDHIQYSEEEITVIGVNRNVFIYVIIGIALIILSVLGFFIFYISRKLTATYQVTQSVKYSNARSLAESESGIVVSRSENQDASQSLSAARLNSDIWTGSGAGQNFLTNRCLLNDVTLLEKIGQGRFGQVWRGSWSVTGDIAIKLFHTVEERAWTRERNIFRLDLLSHANILRFLGSDTIDEGSCTRFCLITEYHSCGSLLDYLQHSCIPTLKDLVKSCLDIATGLAFLHTEISANEHKPAIAHRDLKSANILVKSSGLLCLADFTSSICSYSSGLAMKDMSLYKEWALVGTIRYAAPEVLDGSVLLGRESLLLTGFYLADSDIVNSYQKADIYSLALIYWEMLNRCDELVDRPSQYCKPYSGISPDDPSHRDMLHVVCSIGARPELKASWYRSRASSLCRIITECWSPNSSNRLTSFNIKKQLFKQHFML